MEAHRHSQAVALLAIIVAVLLAGTAHAAEKDIRANSGPSGVTVKIRQAGGSAHATVSGTSGARRCSASRVHGVQARGGIELPSGPNDRRLYLITCPGEGPVARWVDPTNIQDVDGEARRIAQEYLEHIPIPAITVHANPTEGITGLETWVWASGHDGATINDTVEAFGIPVEVEIASGSVIWDFGDGTPAVQGDLGRPYPQRSTVTHVYTHRSTSDAAPDGAYTITATLNFTPRYRVAGGPWETLPPIRTTDHHTYVVREVQAVIR